LDTDEDPEPVAIMALARRLPSGEVLELNVLDELDELKLLEGRELLDV